MANINFVIPINPNELLNGSGNHYTVNKVLPTRDINKALIVARRSFTDQGPTYIIEHFPTYFSVIHHGKDLPQSVTYTTFEDLQKCILSLPTHITQIMEENEVTVKDKYETQTIVKMLVYLYVAIGQALESNSDSDDSLLVSKPKQKKETSYKINRVNFLGSMKVLLQIDLNKFWDPPGVDEIVAGKIAEVVYIVLQKPEIKNDQAAQTEMWNVLGLLITEYNLSRTVIQRLVRIVKEYGHTSVVLPDGFVQLVEVFHCKGFFTSFVHELTEWQITDDNNESAAARNCTKLVVDLAVRLPLLMMGELAYLNKFLRSNSIQLRATTIAVQVEVLIASYNQNNLASVDKELQNFLRNDILSRLLRYTSDEASAVRTRVFNYMMKLIPENIIPTSLLKQFLLKAVDHLSDVTAAVRKAASSLITTMLKFNPHGPSLSKKRFIQELQSRREKLTVLKCEILGYDQEKLDQMDREWRELPHDHIQKLLLNNRLEDIEEEDEDEDSEKENEDNNENNKSRQSNHNSSQQNGSLNKSTSKRTSANASVDDTTLKQNIREAILAKNYTQVVRLCQTAAKTSETFNKLREWNSTLNDNEIIPMFLQLVFFNTSIANRQPTMEELESLSSQERSVDSFETVVTFLELMSNAMQHMIKLLNSFNISDMHGAVEFIIAASQFNLDEATNGMIAILHIMNRNEKDRRKVVLEAMRTVYLVTDSTTLIEHTTQVVNRLITLVQNIPYSTMTALSTLLSEWAEQGILGNDIIDALWQQVLLKVPSDDNSSRAALILLRMAAAGRHSIVEKNYRIVAHIGFGERGIRDLLFAQEALQFVLGLGSKGGSVNSEYPEFRIPAPEPIWNELHNLIATIMKTKTPFVKMILSGAIRVIFKLHSKPLFYMENLARDIMGSMLTKAETPPTGLDIVRFNIAIGEMAVCILSYLDNDIYTELKRRQHAKLAQNKKKGGRDQPNVSASASIARNRKNSKQNSSVDLNNTNATSVCDDSMMDGADAVDDDAEYVSYILEHSLDKDTALGKIFKRIVHMCKKPEIFSHPIIQSTAVAALLRGMLLSSTWCEQYIRLAIIILLKTNLVQNKLTILMHISDLLERYPNVVEPYTPKLYTLLEDKNLEVREMTLKILSVLILKDMIRPQGDIWRLTACIVDPNIKMSEMAKSFFIHSAEKSNNLYNYMPDIFTHLCERFPANPDKSKSPANDDNNDNGQSSSATNGIDNNDINPSDNNHKENDANDLQTNTTDMANNEEKLEIILKYLFSLIDKPKQIEILVERFCLKYEHATEESFARRITFTLTLLQYNARALQKLIENFPKYKHFLLDHIVYGHFKTIISSNKNKDLKKLTTELEDQLKTVFTLDGTQPPKQPVFKKPMNVGRKKGGRPKGTPKKQRGRRSGNDSSSDDEEEPKTTRPRRCRSQNKSARLD